MTHRNNRVIVLDHTFTKSDTYGVPLLVSDVSLHGIEGMHWAESKTLSDGCVVVKATNARGDSLMLFSEDPQQTAEFLHTLADSFSDHAWNNQRTEQEERA